MSAKCATMKMERQKKTLNRIGKVINVIARPNKIQSSTIKLIDITLSDGTKQKFMILLQETQNNQEIGSHPIW